MFKNLICIALIALSFFLGKIYGEGGQYTLDIYAGTVQYSFPLQYPTANNETTCGNPGKKVVLALSLNNKLTRVLDYCGTALFGSQAFVEKK